MYNNKDSNEPTSGRHLIFLLITFSCYGRTAEYLLPGSTFPISGSSTVSRSSFSTALGSEPPRPKYPVQSAHYWKSKCGQNFHITESLRHNGQSRGLQAWSVGYSRAGTYSFQFLLSISLAWSIQVKLGPTEEVGCAYLCRQQLIMSDSTAWPSRY